MKGSPLFFLKDVSELTFKAFMAWFAIGTIWASLAGCVILRMIKDARDESGPWAEIEALVARGRED